MMRTFAALSLAAMIAAGSATSASAFFAVQPLHGTESAVVHGFGEPEDAVYDVCHGRMSGTAHKDCGTATGGPVGGLF